MKTKLWIILGWSIVILITACIPQVPETTPTVDPNSGEQKEYPEFTLEAQNAAMQAEEELRNKARVEGLRDQIPAADWIALPYHGLVLDANLDVIDMDMDTISRMQESMFTILYEPVSEKAREQFGGDLKELFYSPDLQGKEQMIARTAVLNALLSLSDVKILENYEWRHLLIHREVNRWVGWEAYVIPPYLLELLQRYRLPDHFFRPVEVTSEYVNTCQANNVPIPPDWPDPAWVSQGTLAFVFISTGYSAEVYAYKDPAVAGVCYALPRRDNSTGKIELLGIICQSETTGKACFWDNISSTGTRITGVDISLDINSISNGSNLAENCTACHRGYNVFNIHPGSALDLSRAGAPGGPYDTSPAVRYTPIGQSFWRNPGPLVLRAPPAGQASCTSCHELPQTAGAYCTSVLPGAARRTMPPTGTTRAGWPPDPISSLHVNHIAQLSVCP